MHSKINETKDKKRIMKYTVKNFRVFDQEGFEFDFSNPITFLTGCNSSGKSSLVKSLLVLNNYMEGLRNDYSKWNDFNLMEPTLGLSKTDFQLGDFKSVLNRNENDGLLHFSYTIKPDQALLPFTVEYVFGDNEADLMNDASLIQLKISSSDDVLMQISIIDKHLKLDYANLFLLKESYIKYALYQMFELIKSATRTHDIMGDTSGYSKNDIENMETIFVNAKVASQINYSKEEIQSFKNYFANNQNKKLDDLYSLAKSVQQDLIFYSPVIESLNGCHKFEVGNKIRELAVEKNEDLEAVISAFEKSTFDSFTDYLNHLENKQALVFADVTSKTKFPFIAYEDSNKLLSFMDYELRNDYNFVWVDGDLSTMEPIDGTGAKGAQGWIPEEREEANFDFVRNSLLSLSRKIDKNFDRYFEYYDMRDNFPHPGYRLFFRYIKSVIESLLIPKIDFTNVKYVNSESAMIKRLYTLDDNNNSFVRTLAEYRDAKRNYTNNKKYVPDTFLNEWLQRFEIAHHFEIKNVEGGLGATIRIFTDENDKTGHLLADEGYGMTQLFNILLTIETVALSINTHRNCNSVECSVSKHNDEDFDEYDYSLIAIEEPENHLHPNYQSMLAEMFYDAYKCFNIHFIVETHSEYMIRKTQLMVAERTIEVGKIGLFYLYSPNKEIKDDQKSRIIQIEIESDGSLSDNFGSGFYDEATNSFQRLMNL